MFPLVKCGSSMRSIKRKSLIEAGHGLTWTVIERPAVSGDIKKQTGSQAAYRKLQTKSAECREMWAESGDLLIADPDWMRTDITYTMPDGSKALRFEKSAFVAFDLFLLKRPGAGERLYT